MADIKENNDAPAAEPYTTTPEQLAAQMKADFAKYAKIIKAANIRIDD